MGREQTANYCLTCLYFCSLRSDFYIALLIP